MPQENLACNGFCEVIPDKFLMTVSAFYFGVVYSGDHSSALTTEGRVVGWGAGGPGIQGNTLSPALSAVSFWRRSMDTKTRALMTINAATDNASRLRTPVGTAYLAACRGPEDRRIP